jgi:hypothetical protein
MEEGEVEEEGEEDEGGDWEIANWMDGGFGFGVGGERDGYGKMEEIRSGRRGSMDEGEKP